MFIIYEKWNSDGKTGPKSLIPPGFNHFLWHMLWGHAGSIHLWKHMVIKVDDYGWKWMKVHFCCKFFPAFMYIFRKSSKQTPQIVLLLYEVLMTKGMVKNQNLAKFFSKLAEIFVHFTAGPLFHWDVSQKYFHRMIILFHDSGWGDCMAGIQKRSPAKK